MEADPYTLFHKIKIGSFILPLILNEIGRIVIRLFYLSAGTNFAISMSKASRCCRDFLVNLNRVN